MTEKDEVLLLIRKSLEEVYNNDIHLIKIKASERAVVAKFACYFAHIIKDSFINQYDIDVEYNRYESAVKKLSNSDSSVTIDFVVHKRTKHDNMIAIEFKTHWYKDEEKLEDDEDRIQDLCINENYEYKYGFTIVLGEDLKSTVIKFYNKEKHKFEKISPK